MQVEEKGICRLSIIPVRASGSDKSELVTQLLFGDHYEVLEVSADYKWLKIKVYFDQYIGWIDSKQHIAISDEYFKQINNSDYKICTDLTSSILYKKHHINIVIGSILPISTNEIFKMEEQLAFNGEAKSLSRKLDYEFLKQLAQKYMNAPYLWGGRSPFGIDCSGFVQNVFRMSGYKLPRDASQQVFAGELVSLKDCKPGDIAFFQNEFASISHVGIMLEDNKIIHASGKVRIDRLDEVGIFNEEKDQHTHTFHSIKKILNH